MARYEYFTGYARIRTYRIRAKPVSITYLYDRNRISHVTLRAYAYTYVAEPYSCGAVPIRTDVIIRGHTTGIIEGHVIVCHRTTVTGQMVAVVLTIDGSGLYRVSYSE